MELGLYRVKILELQNYSDLSPPRFAMTNLIVAIIIRKSESAVWVTIVENASFQPTKLGTARSVGYDEVERLRRKIFQSISWRQSNLASDHPCYTVVRFIGILEGLPGTVPNQS